MLHYFDELHQASIGILQAFKLQADFFLSELRIGFGHFSVEREGKIGVQLFLELKQLKIRAVPRPFLDNNEGYLVGLRVMSQKINYVGVFECHGITSHPERNGPYRYLDRPMEEKPSPRLDLLCRKLKLR